MFFAFFLTVYDADEWFRGEVSILGVSLLRVLRLHDNIDRLPILFLPPLNTLRHHPAVPLTPHPSLTKKKNTDMRSSLSKHVNRLGVETILDMCCVLRAMRRGIVGLRCW